MGRIHANHWRERAKEMRALAELNANTLVRDAMLKVAEQYDRLAMQSGDPPKAAQTSAEAKAGKIT